MRMISFVMLLLLPAICAAQENVSKSQFTQEEFNTITRYLRDGSIPILSDSLTMLAAQTLRAKIDSVFSKKKPLQALELSQSESVIMSYLMRTDVVNASALLRLHQKLSAVATNGKVKQKEPAK